MLINVNRFCHCLEEISPSITEDYLLASIDSLSRGLARSTVPIVSVDSLMCTDACTCVVAKLVLILTTS